ncbi:MAG: NlpC/P60 family protein [Beijerinckiaceae bacterium]
MIEHDPTAEIAVSAARGWVGTPYLHQASLKGVGCDCLGLLRGIWREVLGQEPELPPAYGADWAEASGRETLAEAARRHLTEIDPGEALPGDVLLFRWRDGLPAKHCGLLSKPGWIIHAHDGAAVCEVPLSHWERRIAFAFRFPDVAP